jgi:CheY-like chemotaxis protein
MPRILIVGRPLFEYTDDLTEAGCDVYKAVSGKVALDSYLKYYDIDLIIIYQSLDMDIDGVELTKRTKEQYPNLPVILVGRKVSLKDKKESGADLVMKDSIFANRLIKAISVLLNKAQIETNQLELPNG